MKTILLLGGYGFLGTNIIKYIDAELFSNYEVIVFDKFPEHIHQIHFNSVVKTYSGDFSDTILIDTIFSKNKIDIVIHSLSTTVPTSSFNARYDIESNLVPTVELLNCMLKYEVKNIVYLSSGGAIYGNGQAMYKHKESDNVSPISSYGVVKLATEKYLLQYAALYGLKPLILRLSNPYGKYHYSMKQGVCNVALQSSLLKKPFAVWGGGDAKKDYIFVEDFVIILFRLLQNNIYNQVLNVGSGELSSVNKILQFIQEMHPDFSWTYEAASQLDVSHFELDTSALSQFITKFEFVSLAEGLKKTNAWQQAEYNKL